jgi:hypothetical protein
MRLLAIAALAVSCAQPTATVDLGRKVGTEAPGQRPWLWSPDSREVIYTVGSGTREAVKALRPADGNVRVIDEGAPLRKVAITADGRALIAQSEMTEAPMAVPLHLIPTAGGPRETLAMMDVFFPPVVAPDSDHVAFRPPNAEEVMVISLADRMSRRVAGGVPFAFSPSSRELLVGQRAGKALANLLAIFDLATGTSRPLPVMGLLSPEEPLRWDGSTLRVLQFQLATDLTIVDLMTGGQTMARLKGEILDDVSAVAWAPDGAGCLFVLDHCLEWTGILGGCKTTQIYLRRLAFATGQAQTLAASGERLFGLVSPDGKTLVTSTSEGFFVKSLAN